MSCDTVVAVGCELTVADLYSGSAAAVSQATWSTLLPRRRRLLLLLSISFRRGRWHRHQYRVVNKRKNPLPFIPRHLPS